MRSSATKHPVKTPKRKRAALDVASAPVTGAVASANDVELPAQAVAAVLEAGPATPTMSLASSCTVKDAAAIRQSLCTFVDSPGEVVIDASAVERVDTAVIQLLYAFMRDRLNSDREVCWRAPSVAFLDAARLLGVLDLLNLPRAAQGATP